MGGSADALAAVRAVDGVAEVRLKTPLHLLHAVAVDQAKGVRLNGDIVDVALGVDHGDFNDLFIGDRIASSDDRSMAPDPCGLG